MTGPGPAEAATNYLAIWDQLLDALQQGHYAEEEMYQRDLDRIWLQLTEDQRDEVERRLIENVLKEGSRER